MIAVGWSSLADTIGRDRLRPCPPERACPTHAGMDVLPHLLHSRRVGAWSMSGHGQEPVPTGLSVTEPYWAEAGHYTACLWGQRFGECFGGLGGRAVHGEDADGVFPQPEP